MAHFAQLDENNKVVNVIVIQNDLILDENGNESEELGIERCKTYTDPNSRWVQTSYNGNFRGKFASINGYYIEDLDVFSFPKQYNSWVFNEETLDWDAPVEMPDDAPRGQNYVWNEDLVNWELYPPVPMPDLPYETPIRYEWNEETTSWIEVEVPKPEVPEESNIDYEWNSEGGFWEIIELEEPVGIAST